MLEITFATMPKSSTHLAIARQWEMLKMIPGRRPGITAAELTARLAEQGFTVSKRTVERDLVDLSSLFGLACNDVSVPYGWHWTPGAQYEFSGVELADAASLCLAAEVLGHTLPSSMLKALASKFERARNKLAALPDHPLSRWSAKVRYLPAHLSGAPPRIPEGVLDAVFDALVSERQMEVEYAAFDAKPRPCTLHPLSLIQKGTTPYLAATASGFADVRLYALHRMTSPTVTAQKSRVPRGYSVDRYIESGALEFGSGKPIVLKAAVSHQLGLYLSETPISPEQKIVFRRDQWHLTAEVRDTWQLHFWILSQGAGITVLSPKDLRARIRNTHEAALGNYA